MAKVKAQSQNTDELASIIASNINSLFKLKGDNKVAFVGNEDTPTDLIRFVSTGSDLLDLVISNRPNGGMPLGRIVELTGLEASGKSLLAAHLIANVQQMGGIGVLIDTETAVNWEFFDAVGVDRENNWVYAHLDTVEDIFGTIESIIESVRKSSNHKPVVIVVDSVAAASTKKEMENTYDLAGYATEKARMIGQALRKITSTVAKEEILLIFTNQLRYKLNAMPFADPYTTSGGKAIAYHSSVRLRLEQTGKITIKDGILNPVVGVKVKAKVVKNRVGPPYKQAEFNVFFDQGIDDSSFILDLLRKQNVIKGATTAKLTYITNDGEEKTFAGKEWKSIWNSELHDELYKKLSTTIIMKYHTTDDNDNMIELEIDKTDSESIDSDILEE